jgi:hypothetical protein
MNLKERNDLLAQIRAFNDQVASYCQSYKAGSLNVGVRPLFVSLLESMARHQTALEAGILSTETGHQPAISRARDDFRSRASLARVFSRMSQAHTLTDDDIIRAGMLLDGHMQCLYGSLESGKSDTPNP